MEFFCARFALRIQYWQKLLPAWRSFELYHLRDSILSICERMVTRILITIPAKLQHGFKVRTVTRDGGCYVRQQSGSLARKI